MSETDYGSQTAVNEKLTEWVNEPTLLALKCDLEACKESQQVQISRINGWNDLLAVKGSAKPKKVKGRSSVQPKLVRRQAEWRYSALSEPFLGSNKLFKLSPTTFEDAEASRQNEILINYQFRTKFNRVKFIDEYVRATVDEGTSILRVGWDRQTTTVETEVPIWSYYPLTSEEQLAPLQAALELQAADPRTYEESTPEDIKAAIEYYNESGQTVIAVQTGKTKTKTEKVIVNKPTCDVLNPKNVYIDPTCNGDIEKAMFIVVSFETCKADLLKEKGRYKNLEKVDWQSATPLSEPDHDTTSPNTMSLKGIRKKVVAYEYWGFYEINNDGKLLPFVATWIGNTLIRMELNPFPDEKLPFILVPYLPVKREIYGEPDAELLEDNQAILGAVSRGMIDLLGRSANGQRGFAKGMLDPLNRRRYDNGQDYEFNPNTPPQQGLIEHKYPELPQSALAMANLQNAEAEAITGVKSFSGGVSGDAYGDVAKGIASALDAAGKREMAILRRLAKGITELGQKIISMNAIFLSEEEVVRVTNEKFVTIKREDLKGSFDIEVDISTAEVDNAKSQDLAFMLQTIGPNEDPDMRRMILSEIADLKRMPELAQRIRNFQPQPDPLAEKLKELQVEELQAKIDKLRSDAKLSSARAEVAETERDQNNLDFVEQESGTKHERNVETVEAQAEGNKELEVTKALLKPKKPDEKAPDIEAAVGFNEMTRGSRSRRRRQATAAPALTPVAPVPIDIPVEDVVDPTFLQDQPVDPSLNPGL
jgi:hypothetical protein